MIVATADRLKATSEYYFSRKLEEIRKMRALGQDVINLGIGSPDMAPALEVRDAAATALRSETGHGYAAYRSSPELRQAMADWYQHTFQVKLNAETEILPLLGSKEGILYISMAYLNPGDAVLVPNPGYPAYAAVAGMIGAKVIYYDLKPENNWLPDFKALEKARLSAVKLMWVNYPHMPTGTEGSDELFKQLVDFCREKNILLCNDNPYGLVLNEQPPRSLLSFDPSGEVAIELNSLSKSFNMAGWRVGMVMGKENAINAILQVKSNVDSGMFSAVQAGAIRALHIDKTWHEERNAIYKKRRVLVFEIFDALNFKYEVGQVGLFVWARAPESLKDVNALVDDLLVKAQVFLTPGFIFGSNGERYARISLCATEKTLAEALKRVQGYSASRRNA